MATNAFRRSMTELHSWAGILLGSVLFAIFWTGTLSVVDREIDAWMIPELRLHSGAPMPLDEILAPRLAEISTFTKSANVELPTNREPTLRLMYRGEQGRVVNHYDPVTGERLELTASLAGTGFIYPFHYDLHLDDLGDWIVGFASMAMLVLLISGLYVHRKIIAEFFIFRPTKNTRRAILDLHNLSSLIALPFCLFITVSGLLHSYGTYIPYTVNLPIDGNRRQLTADIHGTANLDPAGTPGRLASLDGMRADAEARWLAAFGRPVRADYIKFRNLGDAHAVVNMRHINPPRDVASDTVSITYNGATGELVRDFRAAPMRKTEAWITGLHSIQFDHWPLRLLFLAAGFCSCVMIATGLQFWVTSRRRPGALGLSEHTVLAMTVGSVTGIIIATGAFLIVNKILPSDIIYFGFGRAGLEVCVFFLAWALSFVHAALRVDAAWRDQSYAIAVISSLAVALNWITTGDHLVQTIALGNWAIAGVDAFLLSSAVIAGLAAWLMNSRRTGLQSTVAAE